ncbi:hypothetical protein [Oceanospirillum beijerinckii]|uniref:hypothetical protein n=1 Tax=Oceanospirillum beijerinckii TaxID=64976 RepID=UPI0004879A62|nr:hypothetical protein [Oceanospirillum beijerinckii]MAC48069.1 hypothetical protein [Oceanospirillum sp.]
MQVYRVYKHPTKGFAALPSGFNWTAAAFSLLWALGNNLWGPSTLLFIGWGSCIAGIVAGIQMNLQILSLAFLAVAVLLPLWAGMNAMDWLEGNLKKKGFHLVNKVRAQSANGAIRTTQQKKGNR